MYRGMRMTAVDLRSLAGAHLRVRIGETTRRSAMPAGYRSGNKRVRYDTEGGREIGRPYTTPSSFRTESVFGNGCCHSHASRSRKPVITADG